MDNIKLAKILAEETLGEGGAIDASRISAVCDYVEQNVAAQRRVPILRLYLKYLRPILAAQTALVETSGDIPDYCFENVKKFVLAKTSRSDIVFEKKLSPELLGGVRITCGDNIWERSVKSDLESIAAGVSPTQQTEFKR